MPGYDGMGPMGMGSMTGGGFGYCVQGAGAPEMVRGAGRGGAPRGGGRGRCFGGGRGMGGRGFRFSGVQGPAGQDETVILNNRAAALENELSSIRERLAALEKG